MPSGMIVDAPQGYVEMCQRDATLCATPTAATPTEPPAQVLPASVAMAPAAPEASVFGPDGRAQLTPISWTPAVTPPSPPAAPMSAHADLAAPMTDPAKLEMLNRVNRFVNGAVAQRRDINVYVVEEYWRRSGAGLGASGDCKDIAVEKRLELIQQGFPPADLFYAIGFREDIGLHAVLIARTEAGDVVLDSRTPYVVSWSDAPYIWVKRQSREDPQVWALVNGPPQPVAPLRVAALDLNTGAAIAAAQTH